MPDSRYDRAASYNMVAATYDRMRPRYPIEVIEELITLSNLPVNGRILELGCGSGIATYPLAQRGYAILALEAGAQLADLAVEKLAKFPKVRVEVCDVEHWRPERPEFDLVLCAASYHWLTPGERVSFAAKALRPGGALVIMDYIHVRGGSQEFFDRVQDCYRRYMPDSNNPNFTLKLAADEGVDISDLEESTEFSEPEIRKYVRAYHYDSDSYIELLRTYSQHIRMSPASREQFFHCVRNLIKESASQDVVRNCMFELVVSRRL